MSLIFQASLLLLVVYSLLLCIAVPVLYSSASNWSRAKGVILIGSIAWLGMVIAVGILNFLK